MEWNVNFDTAALDVCTDLAKEIYRYSCFYGNLQYEVHDECLKLF